MGLHLPSLQSLTHTHALTLTQTYARALSLSLLLSRALFAAGANGFSNRSLKSALLSSSSSPPLPLFVLLLGEISRRYCSHICLSCRCSLLAARCSLLGCAAASSLLVCWCLRRFYRRRSAFHCLNLCALAPALSRSLSLSPSPSLYLFLSLFVAFAVSLF